MTRLFNLPVALSILAVVVRLIWIDQPYIDSWSWRQSDVAAIARNFYQHGFHFANPQIDWAGDQPGYVGTEFPILPFVAAIIYKFFGVHDWIGRTQSVLFFAASLPFFFLLVRKTWHGLPGHDSSAGCRCHVAALWALGFYSFAPLNVMASRCFMPDVPSLSLSIIGLYFFLRWIDQPTSKYFWLSAVAISLSILIKATSAIIIVPLLSILVGRLCQTPGVSQKRPTIYRDIALYAVMVLLPSLFWYCHAYNIAQRFYPHHFFGAGGIQLMNFSWYVHIAKLIVTSGLTSVVALLALAGVFMARAGEFGRMFHWWLAAMLLFVVIVGYGNRHPWYQLPLVPIAAALAGAACARIMSFRLFADGRSFAALFVRAGFAVVLGSFAACSFAYMQMFYRPVAAGLRVAGLELKRITARDDLIIAADDGDPTIFYYAERKGWHFLENNGIYDGNPSDSADAIDDLEQLRRRGAAYLVFSSNTFWWLDQYQQFDLHLAANAELVAATPAFKIFRLRTNRSISR